MAVYLTAIQPLDVIKTFEHLLIVGVGRWLKDAKWRIKDKV